MQRWEKLHQSSTDRAPSRGSARIASDLIISAGMDSMKPPIERPEGPLAHASAFGSDAIADTLRALALPYIALNPGASFRGLQDSLVNHLGNERPTMLAVPARGICGRDRARLRQGHGQADGGRRAFQRRADAREHGDLQRLVRPHAGARARSDGTGGCAEAPAVDRLDSHRARSGRARASLREMGRSARLARRRARSAAARARGSRRAHRWRRST